MHFKKIFTVYTLYDNKDKKYYIISWDASLIFMFFVKLLIKNHI